ncbi:MAG: YceI family protein [Caldilineaceae bacterium]|nr:YceI family protein [Caldilineaceae bacterium]
MIRKSLLMTVVLFTLVAFTACAAPAPAPAAAPAAEAAPTDAPAEEAAPTEAPAEEAAPAADAAPTEEAAEEASGEAAEEAAAADAVTYSVDTDASTVEWYGERPAGGSESGTVQIAEGELTFAGTELVDGSMVIDMTSITPTSKTGDMLQMLTGHLLSDEFFGVETYPTATLVIKSATPTDVENQYLVVGDLTIKETTAEVEFVTDVTVADDSLAATADIVVDRSVYDVRYGSGTFFSNLGDDLISDEMQITVSLVTTKS